MFLLIALPRSKHFPDYHFNTSHVSINLKEESTDISLKAHFNTSHVSINRRNSRSLPEVWDISIHPMFLLINFDYFKNISLQRFQYIPCFY